MIFIDTHIAIWLYQKYLDRLNQIEKEALEMNEIRISPIVLMEIEYLFEIGRIKKNSSIIIHYLTSKMDLKIDSSDFLGIINLALKEKWTRDPFDRIIVSQAKYRNAPLITKNEKIKKNYSKVIG